MCFNLLFDLALTGDFKKSIQKLSEQEIEFLWTIIRKLCPEKCKDLPRKTICKSPYYFQSIIVALVIIGICDNGQGDESN